MADNWFENFTSDDEGRSRRLVAVCTTPEYAARIVALPELERLTTNAARDVLMERRRQVEAEGWTPVHDVQHGHGEMALAAACYASAAAAGTAAHVPLDVYASTAEPYYRWPWESRWWKPKNPRRDLVRAAALILAEIERLDRIEENRNGC